MTTFIAARPRGRTWSIDDDAEAPAPPKRPSRWSLKNWPVRWKVFAIVLVPLILAGAFGGLRIYSNAIEARDLQRAADRAEMVPAIVSYMNALNGAILAPSAGGDTQAAMSTFDSSRAELQRRLNDTPDVPPDVRKGVTSMLDGGQALLDKVTSNSIGLRRPGHAYAPILLTAEDAITGSVRVDDERIRTETQGLTRAVGARGQMMMEQLLVNLGAELPEPEQRTRMITLAGTEPSTLFGMSQVLGIGSPEAKQLQAEYVQADGTHLRPDRPAGQQPGHDGVAADHRPDRRQDDRRDGARGDRRGQGRSLRRAHRSHPRLGDRARGDPAGAAARHPGGALAGPAAAHAARQRPSGRPRRPGARDRRGCAQARSPGPSSPSRCTPPRKSARSPTPSTSCTSRPSSWQASRAGCSYRSATCSRRCRGAAERWSISSSRSSTGWSATRRIPTAWRACSGSITWPRGCAATAPTCWCSPAPRCRANRPTPVPVAAIINAAASEVEDYTRVVTATVPDSEIVGSVAGDLVHLLAELLDNALRYSPPISQVRVSAVHTGNGGLVIEVSDIGLGMTESDLRVANTRLQSGGEVTPYTARHMGLFVVGRLAQQHGLVVRLRSTIAGEPNSGTTAGVYVPSELIVRVGMRDQIDTGSHITPADAHSGIATALALDEVNGYDEYGDEVGVDQLNGHSEVPVTLLPQRSPGASGISDSGAALDEELPPEPDTGARARALGRARRRRVEAGARRHLLVLRVPRSGVEQRCSRADSTRPRSKPSRRNRRRSPQTEESSTTAGAEDAIYQRMLSEWLVDPTELANSSDLNWESVWDHGWSAAEAAEDAPVASHTEQGLPVRDPGARLVPGAAGTVAPGRQRRTFQRGSAPKPRGRRRGRVGGRIHYRRTRDSGTRSGSRSREHGQPFRRCACRAIARPRDQRNR